MAAVRQEMYGNRCRVTLRLLSGSNTIGSNHSRHLLSAPRRKLEPATDRL